MTPDEVNAAAAALQQNVADSAIAEGKNVDAQAGELAPGLATGTNAPGGYNYARTIAPTTAPLQSNIVVAAKQAVLKQALKDAQFTAQTKYDDANYAYKQRQRDYTKKQALEAKAAQAAAYAAASGGGGSTTSGSGVGSTDVSSNSQYIGNNDYRGRLAYAAANGSAEAKTALNYVGNDGKFYLNPNDPKYKSVIGALSAAGATNAYVAPKAAPAPVVQKQTFGLPTTSPFLLNLTSGKLK